ncbi:DUF3054 domain-containing protein [Chloroflexus sp.]|uniref:DUF3054 domain-containing protein n=1 Tax=Chloroflexus sp. TaxID=1904827 RepID=UPI002ACEB123|nr:DUF3054 domain-containing protein [Chloroflexus sp.]
METTNRSTMPMLRPQLAILLGGDAIVFVVFALLGRSSHGLVGENPLVASVRVALPFFIGWLLVAPWFGLFRRQSPVRMVGLTLGAWLIALPVGLGLRWWQLGRSSPLSFALVTFLTVAALLLIWRGAYSWWLARRG